MPRVFFGSSCLLDFLRSYRVFHTIFGISRISGFSLVLGCFALSRTGNVSPPSTWHCQSIVLLGSPALPGIPGTRWTSSVRPRDGAGTVFRLPIRCFCFLALSVMDQGCCCQTAWHVSTKPRTGKAPSDHNGAAPKNERLIGTSDSTVTTKAEQISVRAASHCTHTSACKSGAGK